MSVLSFRPPPPEFLIECEVRRRIQIKTSWNLILMQALATGIFDEWNERKKIKVDDFLQQKGYNTILHRSD